VRQSSYLSPSRSRDSAVSAKIPARLRRVGVILMIALLMGCATQETPTQRAQRIEPMLAAAGFHVHPADTPARVANLQTLTPLKVSFAPKDGKMRYWFADPIYCQCLYVGNEETYDRYQQLRLQQKLAEEQQETAQINESAAMQEQMDFGMWNDPFFY
jgi:hypothetical protein